MDVKALQARLAAFAAERGWDEAQNPRNLAIALAGEAGMLLDLFRWLTDAQSQRIESEYKREAAEEAIADLLLHTLRIADKLGIDVERAIAKKLAENDANYPLPVAESAPAAAPEPKPVPAGQEAAPPVDPKKAPSPPKPAAVAPPAKATPQPVAAEEKAPSPPAPAAVEPAAKATPRPIATEEKAPPPEPADAAPVPDAPKPAAEPSPAKALPSWLDGILPARGGSARKGPAAAPRPEPEPPKAPPPLRATEPPRAATPVVEAIEAAPPPADEPEREERAPGASPWAPERYEHLDTDAAKGFVKSLAKRVDSARSDDPLLRELHDEVETLRRTLYSPTPKRSWMGDSLKTIRAILEEATTHSVGEELRARDYLAQIERMLNP